MAAKSVSLSDMQILDLFKNSFHEVNKKGGLKEFLITVRNEKNPSIKRHDLDSLFSKAVWTSYDKADGHTKLEHQITKVVIEYVHHGKVDKFDKRTLANIADQVQRHINILFNDILDYKPNRKKPNRKDPEKLPDFDRALENYKKR